jgi:hypothetical protein
MAKQKKLAGPGWWSQQKKIEVVTADLVLGNAAMVEGMTGVPKGTIRQWRLQDWYKEIVAEIRTEEDAQLDVKLSKVIDKSLDAVLDRVENGDFMFDSKTGKFLRKPVHMKDALQAVTQVYDKRNLLRGKPTSRVEKHNIQDNLSNLAAEFAKFAKAKTIQGEVIESTIEEDPSGEPSVESKEEGLLVNAV